MMGSDNGMHGRRGAANLFRLNMACAGAAFSALLVAVVLVGSLTGPSMPDEVHTFDPSDISHMPKGCLVSDTGDWAKSALAQLAEVQSYSHDRALVIACHRIWCRSYGHCEPCSGIGDRTRFLLSLVTDAMERKVPIEIDAPQPGLSMRSDAVYRSWYDKVMMFGTRLSDLVHWRDYDVSSRYVSKEDWGMSMKRTYVHMQPQEPKPYRLQKYDPCLFHALMRPDAELKDDIDRNLGGMTTNRKIGIHLRVGDVVAFGLHNQDVRAVGGSGGLQAAVERMLDCADDLAKRIWNGDDAEPISYFFASDSAEAKALAGQILKARSGEKALAKFYTTDINPTSCLGGAATDREAWLETYLLSNMNGLVMNKTPSKESGYEGKASTQSTFALLAQNIGFIPDERIIKCELR